jgi:hypothetical protein
MKLLDRLFRRGVERRGDGYVVRYEDDTGTHERTFQSKREARNFQTTLALGTSFVAGGMIGGFGGFDGFGGGEGAGGFDGGGGGGGDGGGGGGGGY